MGSKSSIEWTDATWTPIRVRSAGGERVGWGCEKVSDGCKNCYAETLNKRLGTGLPYAVGAVTKAGGEYFLDEEMLTAPLRWRKPRRVECAGVGSAFAGGSRAVHGACDAVDFGEPVLCGVCFA